MKYFISCEYGSDKTYIDSHGKMRKGTSRPHYHVLFFCNWAQDNPDFTAFDFSRLVAKCWHRGLTDGLPNKSMSYVARHIFRAGTLQTDNKRVRKVCNYVAKYVNKDGEWKKLVQERIQKVFDIIYEDEFWTNRRLKETYKKMVRDIDVFHRQSQGFGWFAVEAMDEDEYSNMMSTGIMTMPDNT